MRRLLIIAILSNVICGSTVIAADRIRIAYSSISGAYTGIWVAHDAGFSRKRDWKTKSSSSPAQLNWRRSLSPATSTSRLWRRTHDRRCAQRRGLESIR